MSSETSNFLVGDAQKQCALGLNNRKVKPIGGDGPIGANWIDGRYDAKSSRLKGSIDDNEEYQGSSDFDCWRRAMTVWQ